MKISVNARESKYAAFFGAVQAFFLLFCRIEEESFYLSF
jgi:hypothetical protein